MGGILILCFYSFKKTFNTANQDILWHKLQHIGINIKLFSAIKGLYDKIICTIRIKGLNTEWFAVKCGLKQGCPLSPVLFSFFINDLALKLWPVGR